MTKQDAINQYKADMIAQENAKPVDELRSLRWIRYNVAENLARITYLDGPLTHDEYADLRTYALGSAITDMARHQGITKQRMSIVLKETDRKLRRHLAGETK